MMGEIPQISLSCARVGDGKAINQRNRGDGIKNNNRFLTVHCERKDLFWTVPTAGGLEYISI